MARIANSQKRAWLSWCYDNDAGGDLLLALKSQRDSRASELRGGQVVASTSANNHAVSFSAPGSIGFSPVDLFHFWQEMIELYESRYDALGGTPTDAQVYAEMKFTLSDPEIPTLSFANLRFH